MNQTNQLQGETQHYKLWYEAKKYVKKITQKVEDYVFNSLNYRKINDPVKHYKWQSL